LLQRREQLPVLIENVHFLEDDPLLRQPRRRPKAEEGDGELDGIHLVVFVHGFQGNSFDMRLIKNYVSFLYPESMFLCATSNEDQTDSDILEMGERLANEVRSFITENFPQQSLSKLSFIGHSLGGVKVRAALPRLL
jgi:pimeloyl-ACP methyl ester carboxylesterase